MRVAALQQKKQYRYQIEMRRSICFLLIPSDIFTRFLSLSPYLYSLDATQILGHYSRLSSPPPHYMVRAFHFLSRQDFNPSFPRRLAPNCAGYTHAPGATGTCMLCIEYSR